MATSKQLAATLLAAISMMLLAGIWHEIIMAQFYRDNTAATHEGTGIIFLAYLILAALMVTLYSRCNHHGNAPLSGLKFGALIGLLWVFPHQLAMAGAHGEALPYVFINAAWHMVEQGLGGVVIAALFSRK